MEGVTQEAASLAGHLRLGKLIYLYDQNHISLAGGTDLTFTEDVGEAFRSLRLADHHVAEGNDTEDVAKAIEEAQAEDRRPSLILVRTHIGYGSPKKQDNFSRARQSAGRRGTGRRPRRRSAGRRWTSSTCRRMR